MLAVKSAFPSETIERPTADVMVEPDGSVRAMHRLIEQRMMADLDFVVPKSPLERAIETASRWAAYPSLAIAATCIGLLAGTAHF